MRPRWSTVPRLAALDILDAWQYGRTEPDARRVVAEVYGPWPGVFTAALGIGCAVAASFVETVGPGEWFTWGQAGYAAIVGQRGWRALKGAPAPDRAIRPVLVAALPGVSSLVFAQFVLGAIAAPDQWLALDAAADALISLLGQGTWSLVLIGAFMSSQRWLGTLLELFVSWLFFYLSVGFARMLVELVGEVTLWVGGTVLGFFGLGALATLLELADEIADIGFVIGVLAWVAGAAWLTAIEVLPRRVVGDRVSYIDALKELLATGR